MKLKTFYLVNTNPPLRPVILGEVLFDIFEGGEPILGGAPFNVAWNLKALGQNPLFISRVGDDELGEKALAAMTRWGIDTRGVQIDRDHPTGVVEVSLKGGQPEFSILPDQACDFIDRGRAIESLNDGDFSLLYHGTLLARTGASRSLIHSIRASLRLPVFVDVNLRAPWWDIDCAYEAVSHASWAKLNSDELRDLSDISFHDEKTMLDAAERFCERFSLKALVVTLGAVGSLMVTKDGVINWGSELHGEVIDTVGAGDAFSAVSIIGLVNDWPVEDILYRSSKLASRICERRGAIQTDVDIFSQYREGWRL